MATNEATSFHSFKIVKEIFVAITNTESSYSVIYKWQNNQFEKFQEIVLDEPKASSTFVINNETFLIAFANKSTQQSSVYKWLGGGRGRGELCPTAVSSNEPSVI